MTIGKLPFSCKPYQLTYKVGFKISMLDNRNFKKYKVLWTLLVQAGHVITVRAAQVALPTSPYLFSSACVACVCGPLAGQKGPRGRDLCSKKLMGVILSFPKPAPPLVCPCLSCCMPNGGFCLVCRLGSRTELVSPSDLHLPSTPQTRGQEQPNPGAPSPSKPSTRL